MNGRRSNAGWQITDLLVVTLLVVATTVALLVPGVPWPIEWALALPFVLLLPGYGVVAALLPTKPDTPPSSTEATESPGWAIRFGLAVVASAIVMAVVGVSLSIVESLSLVPAVLGISAFTVLMVVIAWLRRGQVAVNRRADPFNALTFGSISGQLGLSGLQTVTFGIALLALVGALAFAGATPTEDTPYSEMSLVSGSEADALLGADESVTFVSGQDNTVHLQLKNHEGEDTTYRIVGLLQRVGPDDSVLTSREVDRGQVTLADGETAVLEREISPAMTGESLRLRYLVYKNSVPDEPGVANADLALRQWVTVE